MSMGFEFASPLFLLLALLTPCFVWCRVSYRVFYISPLKWINKEATLHSLELWLKIAIFLLLTLALADPFVYDSSSNNHKKGRDLILAIDASGSMAERGFDKKKLSQRKFDTTLELSKDFISKRGDDNIGAVIFGTFAYSASALTYDLQALQMLLMLTDVGVAGESTAIGDALMQSIRSLSYGKAKSKVIILLSDGYHNAGAISPKKALEKAKALGIKIYTIGIGSSQNYDKALLDTIAKQSNAKSYSASSADKLKDIYKEIAKLEPSPIRSENFLNRSLLFFYPLALAFGLLFFWVLIKERQ